MGVFDQANARGHHILGNSDLTGDGLIASLCVIVLMGNGADQGDAAGAD